MEPLTKLVHDVATGEITIVELSPEEIAELPKYTYETPSPA